MFVLNFTTVMRSALELITLCIAWWNGRSEDMSNKPWARSSFDVFCWLQQSETSSACRALANDCDDEVASLRAVRVLGFLRATVANDPPVFASCRKCSGSSNDGTMAGSGWIDCSKLDVFTHVISLNRQRAERKVQRMALRSVGKGRF